MQKQINQIQAILAAQEETGEDEDLGGIFSIHPHPKFPERYVKVQVGHEDYTWWVVNLEEGTCQWDSEWDDNHEDDGVVDEWMPVRTLEQDPHDEDLVGWVYPHENIGDQDACLWRSRDENIIGTKVWPIIFGCCGCGVWRCVNDETGDVVHMYPNS